MLCRIEHEKLHAKHKGHEAMHMEMILILFSTLIVAQVLLVKWKKHYYKSFQVNKHENAQISYVQWIDNWPLTKWRWDAWSIQELPLLVTRRLLSWHVNPGNPAMHPTQKGVEQAAVTLIKKKEFEREGGTGKGNSPWEQPLRMLMFKKNSDFMQKLLQWPVVQEHMGQSWHVHMSKCHWPRKQDLSLLLVTALYFQLQLYSPSQTEMVQKFIKTKINSIPVVYVNFLVQSIFPRLWLWLACG